MELKAKLGTNAEMRNFADYLDDRACEELKARYIAQGIIKPSPQKYGPKERPHMHPEAVRKLRKKWIDEGFLQPKGTINDAFQKRIAAAKNGGAGEAGQGEPSDVRRVEQSHGQSQNPGENNRSTLTQASFSPGPRTQLH